MNFQRHRAAVNAGGYVSALILLVTVSVVANSKTRQIPEGKNAKVVATIVSRDGDLVRVHDNKTGDVVLVKIDDDTMVERSKSKFPFYRHAEMDVTALLPGLLIKAEGVGNSDGQLDAKKIVFSPDDFAIEVAEEQQVLSNKVSAEKAQSTADQATANARLAQLSASQAQVSADQAATQAQLAGALGIADAAAVDTASQRISDLDQYQNKFEVDVFFAEGSVVLTDAAKRDLENLADIAKSLDGYMVEVSGYAAHHKFSTDEDQKLSEERAAAVARYFLEVKNIPMRRILVPVGYGATRPVASNQDPHGRELNRHVDVKVLVNRTLG